MAILHNLQAIAVKLYIAIKIHLMECLHRNLVLATVLQTVSFLLEGEVVLDRTARIFNLLILSRSEDRGNEPETRKDGQRGEKGKEYCRLKAAAYFPSKVIRYTTYERKEENVGKALAPASICGKGCILNCWRLYGKPSVHIELSVISYQSVN
jgi:hypothetical protein